MHLVKWIRKNERKIMAWVVILLMISFVGGYGLQQILENFGRGGGRRIYADYGDGQKIRGKDLAQAQQDLKVLEDLYFQQFLLGGPSWNGRLLGLMLFPDSQAAGQYRQQLLQLAQNGQIQADTEQIDAFFTTQSPQPPEVIWFLLKTEAHQAGCAVSNANAAAFLQQLIGAVSQDQFTAAQAVHAITRETGLTEQQILRVAADLLAVTKYSEYVQGTHNVTMNEVRNEVARQTEKLSAELFEIDAETLIDPQPEPTAEQIQQQFDEYKDKPAGLYSSENPFGFGYQIAKRIQVEYLLLDMNTVKEQVTAPTAEEMEDYYIDNISKYSTRELIDPNDPEGGTVAKPRPFARSVDQIRRDMINERQETLATLILNEARQLTDPDLTDIEPENINADTMQKEAGEYPDAAKKLQDTHQVKIYTGKTGWLQPQALGQDRALGRLSMTTSEGRRVLLHQSLYNITPEGEPIYTPGAPSVRSWENISPLSGGFFSEPLQEYIPLKAMVRVVAVQPAQQPDSPDMDLAVRGAVIPGVVEPEAPQTLHEQIVQDLKAVSALREARTRADQTIEKIQAEDWQAGLAFYKQTWLADADPNDPAAQVETRKINNQRVPSQTQILLLQRQLMQQNAMANSIRAQLQIFLFTRQLYDLIQPDQQTTGTLSKLLVFEPARSVVIVKELTREPAGEQDYAESKDMLTLQTAFGSTMDLALIHFLPENIVQRMQYQVRRQEPESVESEENTEAPNA